MVETQNDVTAAVELGRRIRENVAKVIVGNESTIELMLVAVLCEGHVLLEDVPGTGKTTLAKAMARSLDLSFHRAQCTPDLVPSDLTGVHFYNQREGTFEFRPGPVFTNILLADEINRATPRTQSALLEAMEERQVTIEGETRPLPRPFLVIATQNPIELEGTFPLPEAQLDRFLLQLSLGYPDEGSEDAMLLRFEHDQPLDSLQPLATESDIAAAAATVTQSVRVDPSVRQYLLGLVRATRGHPSLALGASPRGALALFRAARALAALRGRDYVLPDDVKELFLPIAAHRCVLIPQARLRGNTSADVLSEVLDSIPVPIGP